MFVVNGEDGVIVYDMICSDIIVSTTHIFVCFPNQDLCLYVLDLFLI